MRKSAGAAGERTMGKIVCFGELMLRLTPPDREVILQTPRFEATFGGAEANAAVSLANYGEAAAFVSALPENSLGDAAVMELRRFGVDTQGILRREGRLGLYFTETGSNMRPTRVIYDRADSAVSRLGPGDIDWEEVLQDADWFHVTGITPAISKSLCELTVEGLICCRSRGITVSCDLNYRRKLWKWGTEPAEVMPKIAAMADVLIANEEDCQKCLGLSVDVDVESGEVGAESYRPMTDRLFGEYPNLTHVSVSLRESLSADYNRWCGLLALRDGFHVSRKYDIRDIVDRIGGGDSFGSALIHGLRSLKGPQEAVEFAMAASALKHTIYGDFNRVKRQDVLSLTGGSGGGRVQR